jgi:hypothetical protein
MPEGLDGKPDFNGRSKASLNWGVKAGKPVALGAGVIKLKSG